MTIKNLSVREYNGRVKPEYRLTRKEFDEAYGEECREYNGIEIPARVTKSGNPEQMW